MAWRRTDASTNWLKALELIEGVAASGIDRRPVGFYFRPGGFAQVSLSVMVRLKTNRPGCASSESRAK
jgi:hypothetical protein